MDKRDVVLAFDISSKKTGWSVFRNGRLRVNSKTVGTIEPGDKMSLSEKLEFFRAEVIKLLDRIQPTKVVVEDVYVRFVGSAIVLARFSGVMLETVRTIAGFDAVLVTATKARSFLGAGKNKESAFKFVKEKFRLDSFDFSSHNDITDSIVVGLAIVKGCVSEKPRKKSKGSRGKKKSTK